MVYRYIALVGEKIDHSGQSTLDASDNALRAMAMECRLASGRLRIYVSSDTPTISLGERGMVIGHLFSKSGQRITASIFSGQIKGDAGNYLLENFWGEYVAIDVQDGPGDRLTVLRDPSGGVPCVYSITHGTGFITSSISIAAHLDIFTRRIEWDFICHALNFTYLRTTRTGFFGLNELLPGCALIIQERAALARQAWSPWTFIENGRRYRDPREAATGIRDSVATTVRAWAELDGAILLELSGGLDSSIVGACLHDVDASVVCCTLTTSVPGTDERPYARQMTDYLGVELVPAEISVEGTSIEFAVPEDSVVPGIGIFQHAVDQVLTSVASAHNVESFFSGAGGDSVFCYLRNATPAVDALMERGLASCLQTIRDLSTLHRCSVYRATELALKKLLRGAKMPWARDTSFLNAPEADVALEEHPWFDVPANAYPGDQEKIYDLVGSQSFREGMARSTQHPVRFPLLSQPVMETCLSIPTWMWVAGGRNRAVARTAFEDVLPKGVLHRQSKGTYMGYCGAMHRRNRERMFEFLRSGQLQSRNLLDLRSLEQYLRSDLRAIDTSFMRVFDLCMVENWLRHQGA